MEIEIPADEKTVTLDIKRACDFTLRSLLPHVKAEVELVIVDEFAHARHEDAIDYYRLKAPNGKSLLEKLSRSRVVDGKKLLDLTPSVQLVSPKPTLLNGSFATLTDTGCIQLYVEPPYEGKQA